MGDRSPRRRLARTGDHGVGGPLGDWLLSPKSIKLSIISICNAVKQLQQLQQCTVPIKRSSY